MTPFDPARLYRWALMPAAALLLAAGARGAGAADLPVLYIVFRADHTFAITMADGTPVGSAAAPGTVIAAGTYQLLLDDTSEAEMQFDLAGPGVKLVTDMSHAEDPSASFVETFQPSSAYTLRDDDRPGAVLAFSTSATSVNTGSGGSAGPPATTTSTGGASSGGSGGPKSSDVVGSGIKTDPFRGSLAAKVAAAGKVTLTRNGKAVTTIRAGRYRIVVVDASSKGGFSVQEIRRQAVVLTGVAFVGRRAVTVDLRAGQWMFFSPAAAKNYFVVIG